MKTCETIAPITLTRGVLRRILGTVGARPPETGGILLGPVGGEEITHFHFDSTARCTGGTYSPDIPTLARLMKEEWQPRKLDFKGFTHSHPGSFDQLSAGDIRYIKRLLELNDDMKRFIAPIVIPFQHRIRPIVVLRSQPDRPRFTTLRIF